VKPLPLLFFPPFLSSSPFFLELSVSVSWSLSLLLPPLKVPILQYLSFSVRPLLSSFFACHSPFEFHLLRTPLSSSFCSLASFSCQLHARSPLCEPPYLFAPPLSHELSARINRWSPFFSPGRILSLQPTGLFPPDV